MTVETSITLRSHDVLFCYFTNGSKCKRKSLMLIYERKYLLLIEQNGFKWGKVDIYFMYCSKPSIRETKVDE